MVLKQTCEAWRRKQLDGNLIENKAVATRAREYYMHVRRSVKSSGEIKEYNDKGSLTQEEREELTIQQHCFTLVISTDYQLSKLIPNWGATEQPESMYYLQKISRYLWHSGPLRRALYIHLMSELGLKNTDHKVSFLTMCWYSISQQYPWLRLLPSFSIMPPVPTRIATYLPDQ